MAIAMIDATCQKQIPADRDAALRGCRQGAAAAASPAASGHARAMKLRAHPAGRLSGSTTVPGDKSVSHRALMLAAHGGRREPHQRPARGRRRARHGGRRCARSGVDIERDAGRPAGRSMGVGVGGLREPDRPLDLGNSGTGARLLLGLARRPSVHLLHDRRRFAALAPDGPGERAAARRWARCSSPAAAAACRSRSPAATSCCRSATSSGSPPPRSSPRSCSPGCMRPAAPRWSSRRPRATIPSACCAISAPRSRSSRWTDGGQAVSDRRPARASRRRICRCRAALVGRLPPGRGGAGRGLVAAPRRRRRQPAAHRPAGDAWREMGAKLRQGEADGGRAASRRPGSSWTAGPLAGIDVPAERGAAHDRRVSDPRGRRGLRPRHHAAQRARRAARQGERPARRDRRRARRLRRPGRGRRGQPDRSTAAAARRPAAPRSTPATTIASR